MTSMSTSCRAHARRLGPTTEHQRLGCCRAIDAGGWMTTNDVGRSVCSSGLHAPGYSEYSG